MTVRFHITKTRLWRAFRFTNYLVKIKCDIITRLFYRNVRDKWNRIVRWCGNEWKERDGMPEFMFYKFFQKKKNIGI